MGGMGVAGTSATNRSGGASQAPSRETSATVGEMEREREREREREFIHVLAQDQTVLET